MTFSINAEGLTRRALLKLMSAGRREIGVAKPPRSVYRNGEAVAAAYDEHEKLIVLKL